MTDEQNQYTVESYNTDPKGRPQQSDVTRVFAATPQAAALKVLQEELFTIGNTTRLRARVKHLSISGEEKVTTLYSTI